VRFHGGAFIILFASGRFGKECSEHSKLVRKNGRGS
jgi:hypothetical protein